MSTATVELLHPLQHALDRVSGALDEIGDPAPWSLTDREVDALLVGLDRVASRVRARSLDVLAEARRRNRAAAVGATSVNAYLAQTLHVGPVAAARLVIRFGSRRRRRRLARPAWAAAANR